MVIDMVCVVFKTPGKLDLKSLTTFGMNSKPNTKNPIGYFGTGLKYAIAVLLRNKIPVTFWIGTKQYDFYVKEVEFRAKGFSQVMCRARQSLFKWRYTTLPFTTELGKNWELWQAFRELESNTRDENGTTELWNDSPAGASFEEIVPISAETTTIVVYGDAFADCWKDRDKTFLPGGLSKYMYADTGTIQVMEQPSKHIYYRGLRVYDLQKPSLYTYNLLSPVELTEDRTLKYEWSANMAIAQQIVQSTDAKAIAKILEADPDKFYEGNLDFDGLFTTPGPTFLEIMRKKKARDGKVLPRARTYYERFVPSPPDPESFNQKYWYKLQKFLDSASKEGSKLSIEECDLLDDIVQILKRVNE